MLIEGCKVTVNMSLSGHVPNWLKEIPDHLNDHLDQEDVQRGTAHQTIIIRIFLQLQQEPKDV